MVKERAVSPDNGRGRNFGKIIYYSEGRVQLVGAAISTLFSAVLLIGAIACLSAISNDSLGLRNGMIVLFTCLFAFVVGLLTNARRTEIFGAIAAYLGRKGQGVGCIALYLGKTIEKEAI